MAHEALLPKDHKLIAEYAEWKHYRLQISAYPVIYFEDEHGEEVRRTIKEIKADIEVKDKNR